MPEGGRSGFGDGQEPAASKHKTGHLMVTADRGASRSDALVIFLHHL